jgi:glycosyltransferase involved in cell wall biosynthesis
MPSASEGLPLAALEAMSCGAAVVSSDISAFKQIVRNEINGIQVPVGEPLALAQGILKC